MVLPSASKARTHRTMNPDAESWAGLHRAADALVEPALLCLYPPATDESRSAAFTMVRL